jgi:hypothetical protein
MSQVACSCEDCMSTFFAEGSQAYTDDHTLYHRPKCNHITQKDIDKIEYEGEVWIEEIGCYVIENIVQWEGYRCTCEKEYNKEE